MRDSILKYYLLFVLGVFSSLTIASPLRIVNLRVLSVNSAITPATYDYIEQGLLGVHSETLVVIKMNTPGGLVSTTKDIIALFGKSEAPVAVWITPEGASASSAGSIIASAAHLIFMSPGTNLGAATPVGPGSDLKESDGKRKAISDLTALVRSLSSERGRPSAPFEQMISEAKSFTAKEAAGLHIIDGLTSSINDLISTVNGKTITIRGQKRELEISSGVKVEERGLNMGQRLLDVLANPSLAYFLFLLGIALIYFEMQAPGGYVAGATGTALLILAAVAFQVLPLNWGAMGLILVGMFFLVLEMYVTSYGLLALAGIACFVSGSLFLFKGEGGFISVDYPVLISILAAVGACFGFFIWYLYQDKKKQQKQRDFFAPAGEQGTVVSFNGDQPMIKVRGEIWKAFSDQPVSVGDQIQVMKVDSEHLVLYIRKV